MNQEQRDKLLLAFGQLERFSVPGIGTFRKERVASRVDGLNKRVMPPAERFVLEPGEHHISALTEFLFRHLQINHGAAEALVRELGNALRNEAEREGQADLPGVGVLSRDRLYGFQLQANDLEVPELFGLGEIKFKAQQAAERKATASEKQKVIVDHIEQNTVRVEPAPPPVRRRRSPMPWIIVLLLIVLVSAGVIFWPQIQEKMVAWGILKDTRQIASVDTLKDTHPADTNVQTMPVDTLPTSQLEEPKQIENPVAENPTVTHTPSEKPIKPSPPVTNDVDDNTVPAVRGMHYLVVSSSFDKQGALNISKGLNRKKYSVKVIRPSRDGFYRVTVFASKDKAQVIQKMVEWKNDFQGKSYIFSN
jgi:hypothetical protein